MINSLTFSIQPGIYAFAFTLKHTCTFFVAMLFSVVGATLEAIFDSIAFVIQPVFDAVTFSVESLFDTVTPIIGERKGR